MRCYRDNERMRARSRSIEKNNNANKERELAAGTGRESGTAARTDKGNGELR